MRITKSLMVSVVALTLAAVSGCLGSPGPLDPPTEVESATLCHATPPGYGWSSDGQPCAGTLDGLQCLTGCMDLQPDGVTVDRQPSCLIRIAGVDRARCVPSCDVCTGPALSY